MSAEWIAGHVRVVAEGPDRCLLVPPSRTVLRVRVAAERMRSWLALLDGTRTEEELLAAAPIPVGSPRSGTR